MVPVLFSKWSLRCVLFNDSEGGGLGVKENSPPLTGVDSTPAEQLSRAVLNLSDDGVGGQALGLTLVHSLLPRDSVPYPLHRA